MSESNGNNRAKAIALIGQLMGGRPRTILDLRAETGMDEYAVKSWVSALEKAGMVKNAGHEPRNGRPGHKPILWVWNA